MIEEVNVQRTLLIEKLNEKLAENKRERDEKAAKANAKLDELLPDLSEFERRYLTDMIRTLRKNGTWDSNPNDREESGYRSAPDENPAALKVNPDEEYERVIRVLEMSTDETITVEPDTDIYNML